MSMPAGSISVHEWWAMQPKPTEPQFDRDTGYAQVEPYLKETEALLARAKQAGVEDLPAPEMIEHEGMISESNTRYWAHLGHAVVAFNKELNSRIAAQASLAGRVVVQQPVPPSAFLMQQTAITIRLFIADIRQKQGDVAKAPLTRMMTGMSGCGMGGSYAPPQADSKAAAANVGVIGPIQSINASQMTDIDCGQGLVLRPLPCYSVAFAGGKKVFLPMIHGDILSNGGRTVRLIEPRQLTVTKMMDSRLCLGVWEMPSEAELKAALDTSLLPPLVSLIDAYTWDKTNYFFNDHEIVVIPSGHGGSRECHQTK